MADRFLGVQLKLIDPGAQRMLATQYMHRFLLWQTFSETLLAVLPHIRLDSLERFAQRALPRVWKRAAPGKCSFCKQTPSLPFCGPCRHVACYYCIATEMQEGNARCPVCDQQLTSITYAYA